MMHVTDYTFVLLGGVALYFLWKRFGLRDTLWAIVFIALAITLSDQICGNYIRDLHIRLRPCHMEELAGKFRSVREWETGYCGGLYGFVSAHAGNAFALATFAWSALRKYQPHIGWFVFVPAVVIAYSRIYIGVHMPGDVLVGGLIGAGCGSALRLGLSEIPSMETIAESLLPPVAYLPPPSLSKERLHPEKTTEIKRTAF